MPNPGDQFVLQLFVLVNSAFFFLLLFFKDLKVHEEEKNPVEGKLFY